VIETGRPRVLLYAQGLVGVGHSVRIREIARTLSVDFDVHLIDGGRSVAEAPLPPRVGVTRLPPVYRDIRTSRLAAVDGEPITAVLRRRQMALDAAVCRFAADVLVIEYFPFQRWELSDEIVGAIVRARRLNPKLLVCCSVRDVPRRPRTRDECEKIAAALNEYFDYVLVHGDERITRLEEHFPDVASIKVPVVYTGYVARKAPLSPAPDPAQDPSSGDVVVSAGGGIDALELMSTSAAAWKRLVARGDVGDRQMVFFLGPFTPRGDCRQLRELSAGGPFHVRPFSDDFLCRLRGTALSVSRAGYNTCTDILGTSVPALLVPGTHVGDQVFRAQRFAERRLAATIALGDLDADRLAEALLEAMNTQHVRRDVALDGAEFTQAFLNRAMRPLARLSSLSTGRSVATG